MVDRKPERFRREILEEELFETPTGADSGRDSAAPIGAKVLYKKWKNNDNGHPQVTKDAVGRISEFVKVAMGPIQKDGIIYYSVRREVVYPEAEAI